MNESNRQDLGEAIRARLLGEIFKLGFAEGQFAPLPEYAQADFSTARDPFSGDETLIARWRNERGHEIGSVKFHGDGTFYAEFDVLRPHPSDPRWFVEGVTAWGKGETIKAEPKFLAALAD